MIQEALKHAGLATTCCFCGEQCGELAVLKAHSAACEQHPLAKEVARLRSVLATIRDAYESLER